MYQNVTQLMVLQFTQILCRKYFVPQIFCALGDKKTTTVLHAQLSNRLAFCIFMGILCGLIFTEILFNLSRIQIFATTKFFKLSAISLTSFILANPTLQVGLPVVEQLFLTSS